MITIWIIILFKKTIRKTLFFIKTIKRKKKKPKIYLPNDWNLELKKKFL